MTRNRTCRVRFPVFQFDIRVIAARNVVRTGKRLNADLTGCEAAFISTTDKPMTGWIVFGPGVNEATVAHEASHAIRRMLSVVGARNDDETFAYHLDYLVGKIHDFLKKGSE